MTIKESDEFANGKKILTLLNDKPENIPWNKYGTMLLSTLPALLIKNLI
jgi:hypothetical protein